MNFEKGEASNNVSDTKEMKKIRNPYEMSKT